MAQWEFNTDEVEGDIGGDFAPIPKGRYKAVVTRTELGQPNEKGTQQLRVEHQITEGQFSGRTVTTYITITCPHSPEAQSIGRRLIKSICEACGMKGFSDTDELVGRGHEVDVADGKPKQDGRVFSEVKRAYPSAGAAAAPRAPSASAAPSAPAPRQAAPQASAPSGARPAWMK